MCHELKPWLLHLFIVEYLNDDHLEKNAAGLEMVEELTAEASGRERGREEAAAGIRAGYGKLRPASSALDIGARGRPSPLLEPQFPNL